MRPTQPPLVCWTTARRQTQPPLVCQWTKNKNGAGTKSMLVVAKTRLTLNKLRLKRYNAGQEGTSRGKTVRNVANALNNIIGGPVFGGDELSEACTQVLQASQDPEAMHRRAFGWYSHSVLGQCLQNTLPPMYRLLLTPCTQSDWEDLATNPAYHGALVNCANRHWTAVVKHNDLLFYFDSMKEPILHMEADFLSLLGSHPMVFCVVSADYEVPIDAANLAADYKL